MRQASIAGVSFLYTANLRLLCVGDETPLPGGPARTKKSPPSERKGGESPRAGLNCRPHPYQGCALPLSYRGMVGGEGFEPSKAEPSDLQSDPFGRSGTPPNQAGILYYAKPLSSIFSFKNLRLAALTSLHFESLLRSSLWSGRHSMQTIRWAQPPRKALFYVLTH